MTELPSYTIRQSARAKHARLRLSADEGLTVVVPIGFDLQQVPTLIKSNLAWLERSTKRLELVEKTSPTSDIKVPDIIELAALGEAWQVERRLNPLGQDNVVTKSARIVERHGNHLVVSGSGTLDELVNSAIQRWLSRRATATLVPWLFDLASERGFEVRSVTIRQQRSRWASCSTSAAISLNRALLFLPKHLVDHVMLHELCHLREMNHSPRFYKLLRQHDPCFNEVRAELKGAWKHVPKWAIRPHHQ